ncbi:hypothetical protein HUF15_46880 [Streptomyces samsunensis]|uniref:Lipoprotein n=2 Tax=Streptomyces TaxID=1883 RepID=A0A2J7ZCH5_STRMQ|nr:MULTISPECIES: hypothetical protein [Streptomyces]MYU15797.1 hypothetical protein [Streptomyces sp. SID8361]AQA12364.1 hypothetical protein BV401_19770 [Streptomyces autolyticus]AUA13232.1 hypothetical protein CFP59_05387 [Streptomyces sp. M56]MCC4318236.1 hypothetical protein [Streptomyces malaysiensis]MCM3812388.1 hypothetical protein [Streptomyces sp. DR7-3]
MSARWKRSAALLLTGAVALLAAGCGIRGTSVPVDAGAAPSRASCRAPASEQTAEGIGRTSVRIYLLCSSRILSVSRATRLGDEKTAPEPVRVAQALLEQLRLPPTAAEAAAGFSTAVEDWVEITGPAKDDPDNALRLNRPPEEIQSLALAQIICTFADTAVAGDDGKVVLGGPDSQRDPLKAYQCTEEMRRNPVIAVNSGVLVS